ncbi:MAG: EamA family transporter [Pseudonocardiales bacterium]|nr:MAG: EamA family transporter [Pseudonocardiales bacterium]
MGNGSARGAGLLLAVLSAATFGTAGAFATSLSEAGWSPGAAVTTRVSVAALVLTVPALLQLRGRWGLLRRGGGTLGVFGLFAVAAAQLCFFNAVTYLSVGVALLLEYLGTVLVVGWLWLRHGHRPRRLTVAGGVIAMLGLGLVLDLAGSHRLDPVGVLWGLGAAVGLAVYFVISAATDDPLPPLVMAWGGLFLGALALLALGLVGAVPLRATTANVRLLDHQVSWLVPVLGLSLVAAVVAYVSGINAARLLGAKVASFIGLTEVMFAVVFAWLLLGQVPVAVQFVGGGLIIAGIALVRIDELRAPEPEQPLSAAPEMLRA